ncbi:MAG: hypothetical protein DMD64_06735, partial [Gemmatimonadetes bacterium]
GAEQQRLAAAPTANAEAYQAYLQGREYSTRPGFVGQNYEIGQQLFERALALDSGFALAHAALSQVHGRLYSLRLDPSPARFARQREEAEAALRLAPSLPQAHLAMAGVYRAQYDLQLELGELAIALKGLPADAELWSLTGAVHRRLGKWSEAISRAAGPAERKSVLRSRDQFHLDAPLRRGGARVRPCLESCSRLSHCRSREGVDLRPLGGPARYVAAGSAAPAERCSASELRDESRA